MHTTYDEARGSQPKVAAEMWRLTGLWPTAVGLKLFADSGWGFKINVSRLPESGIALPDQLFGIPAEFELRGTAVMLSQPEIGADAAE